MALWYIYLASILGFVAVFGVPAKHGQSEGDALMDQMYDLYLKEQNNELKSNSQRHDVVPNDPRLEVKPKELPHQTKDQRLEDPKSKQHDVDPNNRFFNMEPRDRNDASPKEGIPASHGNMHVDDDPLYVNVKQKDQWHDIKIENQRPDSVPQELWPDADPRPQELWPDADPRPQELRPDANPHPQELRPNANPHPNTQELRPDADPRPQELRSDVDPHPLELRPNADSYPQKMRPDDDLHPQELRPDANNKERIPTVLHNTLVAGATNVDVEPKDPDYDMKIANKRLDTHRHPQGQGQRLRFDDADRHSYSEELRHDADHQEGMSTILDKTLVVSDTYVNVEPSGPNYDIKIVNKRPDADPHSQRPNANPNPHPDSHSQELPNADHQERIPTVLDNTLVAGATGVVEPNDPNYDFKIVNQRPNADHTEQKPDTIEGSSPSLDNPLVAGHMFVNVEPQDPRNDVNIKDQWLDADPVDQQYISPKDANSIPLNNALFTGATLYINLNPKDQSYDVMPEKDQMHDVNPEDTYDLNPEDTYDLNPEDEMHETNIDEDRNDDSGLSEDDWQNTIYAESPEEPKHRIHSTPLFTMYGKVEADVQMHPGSDGSALVSSKESEPPRMRNPHHLSMLLKKMLLAAVPQGPQGISRSDPPLSGAIEDSKNVPATSTKRAFSDMNMEAMELQSTSDEPKLRKLSEILVGIKRRLDNGREESKDRRVFTHLLTYTSIAVVIFVVLSFLTMMTLLCWSVQHL